MPRDAIDQRTESMETPITAAQKQCAPQVPADMHPAPGEIPLKSTADEVPAVEIYDGSRELKVRIRLRCGLELLLWAVMSYYYDWENPYLCTSAITFLYIIVFV